MYELLGWGLVQNSDNVSVSQTKPWYKRTGWIIVLLIFFFPLGILLMWLFAPWSNRTKGIITGLVGVIFLITMINDAATPEPKLNMNAPSQATTVTKADFQVKGKVTPSEADVSVNGDNVTPNGDGSFDVVVDLEEGGNEIDIIAVNGSKQIEYSRVVTRKLTAEEAAIKKEAEKKAAEERDKREAEEQARLEAEQRAEEEQQRADKQAQKEADKAEEAAQREADEAEEAARTPEPISLSGSGQQATDPFQLEPGLAVVSMTHQGDANFIVDLLDENGTSVAPMGVANQIGPFEGSIAVQTSAGDHLLDVQANGPWTIEIKE